MAYLSLYRRDNMSPKKEIHNLHQSQFLQLGQFLLAFPPRPEKASPTRVNESGENDSWTKLVQPARHLPFYQVVPYFLEILLNPLKQNKFCVR